MERIGTIEKRIRNTLTDPKMTSGYKCAYAERTKRTLLINNQWDGLSYEIKFNLNFYAGMFCKFNSGVGIECAGM